MRTAGLFRVIKFPGQWADQALFPETCWVTGAAVTPHDQGLSPPVRRRMAQFVSWPFCRKCGSTLGPFAQTTTCPRCAARSITVGCLVRAGPLSGPLSSLIHQFKFHRHWAIAPILAHWMHHAMQQWADRPVDMLIPIPLHAMRRWNRGFNQAEELAHAVGDKLHAPMAHVLRRVRATRPQTQTQSVTARAENLRGAFSASTRFSLAGMNIWLVDDVCTTGATLHAGASALRALPKELRPATINALVAAVADNTPIPE